MHVETETLIAALRARGFRITAARRAVCEVVAASHDQHLTAAKIFDEVARRSEVRVDRSTIYRTLEALTDAGVLRHGHLGHGPAVYHLTDEAPHQHLVCRSCGSTTSIGSADVGVITDRVHHLTGFTVDVDHFALSGLCADCSAAGR